MSAVGSVSGLVGGFGGAIGGAIFGIVAGFLLDRGFGYGTLFFIVGTFHLIGFLKHSASGWQTSTTPKTLNLPTN